MVDNIRVRKDPRERNIVRTWVRKMYQEIQKGWIAANPANVAACWLGKIAKIHHSIMPLCVGFAINTLRPSDASMRR